MLNSYETPPSRQLHHYHSLMELRRLLTAADGQGLHAVVALDPAFAGDLIALIHRRQLADALTLTVARGQFPPLPDWSFMERCQALGWQSIRVAPNFPTGTIRPCDFQASGPRVELFWPAWRPRDDVRASPGEDNRSCAKVGTLLIDHPIAWP